MLMVELIAITSSVDLLNPSLPSTESVTVVPLSGSGHAMDAYAVYHSVFLGLAGTM